MKACAVACALGLSAGFAGSAHAESYLRATYDSTSLKPDGGGPTTKGKGVHLDLRQDGEYLPLFLTFGADGDRYRTPTGGPFDITGKDWGFNVGLGYANHPSARSEWSFRVEYSHLRSDAALGGAGFCCANRDAGTAALGGYDWFNTWLKGFAELRYTKAAHKEKDYGGKLGLEFAVTRSLRLFADYDYSKLDFGGGSKGKGSTIEAGIKIPFGGKAGPHAKPAAAATEVTTIAPAPKGTVGQVAKLKPGAQLHGQPKAEAAPAPAAPDGGVTLQNEVTNPEGTWWYVQSGDRFGWARDTDLDLGPAK